jgi:hypothetical protein
MQCLEIYTGEAYTLPINFTLANGDPANALQPNAWSIDASAVYYTVEDVSYELDEFGEGEVILGNLTINDPQPSTGDYTLIADWSDQSTGAAYLYVGDDITGNASTPTVDLANSEENSTLFIVTIKIEKESTANAALTDVSREPIGFIVRYQ